MRHQQRWTDRKIAQRLALIEPLVYRTRIGLPPFRYLPLPSPSAPPPVSPEVDDSGWQVILPDSYWGAWRQDFILRTRFTIPADWAKGEAALYLPIGIAGEFSHPETLAYIDGEPLSSVDRHHHEVRLPARYCDGREHVLALHGWVGNLKNDPTTRLQMRAGYAVAVDAPTRSFIALARCALGIANALPEDDPARGQLYSALDEAFILLDTREPFGPAFYASLPAADAALREGVSRSGHPLPVEVYAVGHAHIDVAWLWVLGQTRRKAQRTFYNALGLMEQFPGFVYAQSQPQLYDFIRQDDPALFARIQQAVARGSWEPLGGMWVEADCNLSGGESLARQFLLGRDFFRRYFGEDAESPVLWLPDVFGYAWNLPQLIKEAGLDYFFTIKIGWSQYNRFPYESFWWQGLDGTRVLTHFSTTHEPGREFAATYNAMATPDEVLNTWTSFKQKDAGRPGVIQPGLMSYGHGDGGGGPTREMLENIETLGCFPSTPRVHFGKVGDFFRHLQTSVGERLPTWNGELYLEYHRGTYTTQARNKRANRKSEFLLHDAEALAALAEKLNPAYRYPIESLRRAWELVCLNQFHDIIPGSSIGEVYAESLAQYEQVREIGETARDEALAAIGAQLGAALVAANPTGFTRRELAFWQTAAPIPLQRADGESIPMQVVEGGALLDCGELPPYSVTPLCPARQPAPQVETSLRVSPQLLENTCLRVEFNPAGDITRIYDKRNAREVMPAGAIANQLLAFEDRPKAWDAWDIEIYYDDRHWLADPAESVRVVEAGPLRATLEIRRKVLNSPLVQRISLCAESPRLDFDTTVQWRERHILLKTAFPVDVLAPQATYEIQWGNVQRPTHRNTSWDWARFETCAQKWVDLSEGGYGASLLNDCKYGHDIQGNVIRLSLLRSPTSPDPQADQGEQHFAYSLLPHAGGWDEQTVREAYALNDPLIVKQFPAPENAPQTSASRSGVWLASVDAPNVVIETVKRAEDGDGLILRLYETQRKRSAFTLTLGFPVRAAWRANLLEQNQFSLSVEDGRVRGEIRPYQVMTVRIR